MCYTMSLRKRGLWLLAEEWGIMILIFILSGVVVFFFLCMLKAAGREEKIQEKVKYDVNHKK